MRELITQSVASAITLTTGKISNPLDSVTPSITVFGVKFANKAGVIAGGIWGLCLLAGAVAVIMAAVKWGYNSKVQHSMDGTLEAAGQFKVAIAAFAGLCAVSLIIGAIIFVFQG
ncbi:hypothetical protein [Luteimicrobium sp. DT211]|uniref:hypothetical protein n=1 Tax=Luteimicrobium sp. DT211 TaxID=3393412 RepID=UPI003CE7AC26